MICALLVLKHKSLLKQMKIKNIKNTAAQNINRLFPLVKHI